MNLPMESVGDRLAALNATLNAVSAVLAVFGYIAIKRARRPDRHKALMLAALTVSTAFLASYLIRIALTGTHRYPGDGVARLAYLAILASHVLLAIATVPLVLAAVLLALRRRFAAHVRVVRVALPVWLYVSVTGVVVYLMLYSALGATRP